MLSALTLVNYQKHKLLEITFDQNITTIVGSSERGKSAIIRALVWLALNRWNGSKKDIHSGATFAKVKLKVDGREVVRKSGKGNLYRLDKKVFRAFGNQVPQEIAKLLNVSEVNFQEQFEPHFWLSQSPGEVSRELNAIVDLDVIDTSLAELASETRKAKLTYEINKDAYSKAVKEKKALEWTVDADEELGFLLDKNKLIQEKQKGIQRIDFLIQEVTQHQTTKRIWEECGRQGEEIVSKGERLANVSSRLKRLIILIASLDTVERITSLAIPKLFVDPQIKIQRLSDLINQLEETECLLSQICPSCGQPIV
jgi:exonuclease SbcC